MSQLSSRFNRRFERLNAQGQKAFIPFTLLGWPDAETSFEVIKTMIEAGASALELGLAFSDPVADGPIIQTAVFETLASGFRVNDALALLKRVRALDGDIPISLMVYYNMVLARGVDRFFAEMAEVGVDGVLIVDLPPEVSEPVTQVAKQHGVASIFIISPLTTDERLQAIARQAEGYLYAVSRLGITGVEERYDLQLQALLQRTKALTALSICVGFGISTPIQARQMFDLGADGVITGSKIIQLVRENITALRPYLLEMQAKCSTQTKMSLPSP